MIEDTAMAQTATKLPLKTEHRETAPAAPATARTTWHPVETLRRQIDQLFQDFDRSFMRWSTPRSAFDLEPAWFRNFPAITAPAVDIVEHDKEYVIEAEIPGLDERHLEVTLSNGILSLKGEKREDKEERKSNHYLSERYYGSFERSFRVPAGVDIEHIEASYSKGLLKVVLPKSAEAQKPGRRIDVKTA